jgi:hypothetical protein
MAVALGLRAIQTDSGFEKEFHEIVGSGNRASGQCWFLCVIGGGRAVAQTDRECYACNVRFDDHMDATDRVIRVAGD